MKKNNKLFIIIVWLLGWITSFAQTTSQNYIRTRVYTNESATEYLDRIDYFDGLGRQVETVEKGITFSTKRDRVTLREYDGWGRPSNVWLPAVIASNNGAYVSPATVKTNAQSAAIHNNTHPYSRTVYEQSPLDRVAVQYGPGAEWQNNNRATRTGYLTNITKTGAISIADSLVCALYTVSLDRNTFTLSRTGNYEANQLFVTRMTDEEGNKGYQFTNKNGEVVLTRQINNDQLIDTYYIYDGYGNLRIVLPPAVAEKLSPTGSWNDTNVDIMAYAYLYGYDYRNRCIRKKHPGAGWTYYVYDKADRLIFTQDAQQRTEGIWYFTIPDDLGRIVLTGTCTNSLTYNSNPLAGKVVTVVRSDATGNVHGYTKPDPALNSVGYLQINYYDDYSFIGKNGFPSSQDYNYTDTTGFNTRYTNGYKGLMTGTITALDGETQKLYTVNYYDSRGRLIQSKTNNHLGGFDKGYIAYNFTGQPVKQTSVHSSGNGAVKENYQYTYDHGGRLLKVTLAIDNQSPVILAENEYDNFDRLLKTKKNNLQVLQENYTYNIRSWLTNIDTGSLFAETLTYTPTGNIKSMEWGKQNDRRTYEFSYDGLSRLTEAICGPSPLSRVSYSSAYSSAYGISGSAIGPNYSVFYTYDKQGNITNLTRWGETSTGSFGILNNLTAYYQGNQLQRVNDSANNNYPNTSEGQSDYIFNQNGAMIKDLNKGIVDIQYNFLNLPRKVDIRNNETEARNEYLYSAGGEKLRVTHKWNPGIPTGSGSTIDASKLTRSKVTDYVGNKVYEDGLLAKVLVSGGYYNPREKKFYFYIQDHLGSNRIVTDQTGSITQENNYYPFGMTFEESETDRQPYKYNGKELDSMHKLNLYDYSARFYDPIIGRFTTMDPLSEKYYSMSPYAYCFNNPLRFIDKDGKRPGDVVVAFAGADFYSNGGLGDAPAIIKMLQPTLKKHGGVAKAFSSRYWGVDFTNSSSLDVVTQQAYDYINENYNMHEGQEVEGGRIIIQGFSLGGEMANHLAKRLQQDGKNVELLITVDAARGPQSNEVNREISSNVKKNINYYQTKESIIGSRGRRNKAEDKNKTTIQNIKLNSAKKGHGKMNELTKHKTAEHIVKLLEEEEKTDGFY